MFQLTLRLSTVNARDVSLCVIRNASRNEYSQQCYDKQN